MRCSPDSRSAPVGAGQPRRRQAKVDQKPVATVTVWHDTLAAMDDSARLRNAYDEQLRTDAETPSALSITRHGPLRLVTFAGGRGFVTYRDLDGADADAICRLVPEVLAHYRADPAINRVEWKTRGHDHAPGLHETLLENGFTPDEQ